MASAEAHLPPWDERNIEEGGLFCDSQYRKILNKACVQLRDNLRMADMWPHLRQMGVLSKNDEERMRLNAVNCEQVDRLVDFMDKSPVWRYHALLRAMALTQQGHLIPVGGLPPAVYMEGIDIALSSTSGPSRLLPTSPDEPTGSSQHKCHFYRRADSDVKLPISRDLLPALLRHCEVSQEYLMMAPLFGFDDDIMIDITKLHIETSAQCTHEKESKTIGWMDLFCKLFDKERHAPNTLLMEGEGGSGKTIFLENYALRHCKEFTECEQKGSGSPCPGHSWKLILYIPAVTVIGSQMDAIRDNLYCDDKDKDHVMTMIKDNGEGVLVMNDGLDELRKEAEKKSLREYTESHQRGGRPKVLNSARHGLSNIKGKFFDRTASLQGFTIDEGLLYVNDYYTQTPENKSEHLVLFEYIQQQKTELEWLLTNPLRTHVFSHLSANGQLELNDVKHLTQAKLLKVLESYVVTRDETIREADTAKAHSAQFYRLCLECLLKERRNVEEKRIPPLSPYNAFLTKYKERGLYAKVESYFKFGHEVLFEFFSVQGLCQYLHLCANPAMRNVIQLLFSHISEYEPDMQNDLVFIARACIILQMGPSEDAEHNFTVKKHTRPEERQRPLDVNTVHELNDLLPILTLLSLPALIKKTSQSQLLDTSIDVEPVIKDIREQIEVAFEKNDKHLRAAGWFLHIGYNERIMKPDELKPTAFLKFIVGCIRQCSSSLQEMIYSQTIHKLIPTSTFTQLFSVYQYRYMYPMSGVRWGVIVKDLTSTSVSCWCPEDVASTLRQFYRQCTLRSGTSMFFIRLDEPASMWGTQPPEVLSCNQWVLALNEVCRHRVDRLLIYTGNVSGTIPVDGLLQALQCATIPTNCLTDGIYVTDGQVSEEVLVSFCEWLHTVRHTVGLHDMTVLLSRECNKDYVTRLHQRVQHVMDSGQHPPTYKTPKGHTVR